jgi:hypothetical protein
MCHTSSKPLRKRHKDKRPRKPSREKLLGDEGIALPKWGKSIEGMNEEEALEEEWLQS